MPQYNIQASYAAQAFESKVLFNLHCDNSPQIWETLNTKTG